MLQVLMLLLFTCEESYREVIEKPRDASEFGSTSSPLHFVHLRGLPFQASAQDIVNVRYSMITWIYSIGDYLNPDYTLKSITLLRYKYFNAA